MQNGVGYDDLHEQDRVGLPQLQRRTVIDVQHLLGLPDSTPNPHLWYDPPTMPTVAAAMAADLSAIEPAHAAYFKANAEAFVGLA